GQLPPPVPSSRADRPRRGLRTSLLGAVVVVAVGLAFADASVVVLALPDLYREFDTSVVGVSWVLTAYAIVVTLAALVVAAVARWIRPVVLVAAGLALFGAASLA